MTEKPLEKEVGINMSIQANGFPFSLFKEWEKDCRDKYGNCRWMKMWNDHLNAVGSRITDEMLAKLALLDQRIADLEGSGAKKEEKPKPLTFGDASGE